MSDQERKGTSTIIKGFARRSGQGRTDTEREADVSSEEQVEHVPTSPPSESVAALEPTSRSVATFEPLRGARQVRPSAGTDTRLAVAPLSTLLPRFGEVGELEKFRSAIVRRHTMLQQARRENADERAGRQSAEELMLSQLVVWLGEDGGDDE